MSGTTNVPCVCVLVREQGKVLFVLRENTGFKDGEYAVPGGHVEENESFLEAACREILEEVGLQVRPEDMEHRLVVHRKSDKDVRIDMWFEATSWTGEPKNSEPDKHARIEWFDPSQLPDNVVDYVPFGIEKIQNNITYADFA